MTSHLCGLGPGPRKVFAVNVGVIRVAQVRL